MFATVNRTFRRFRFWRPSAGIDTEVAESSQRNTLLKARQNRQRDELPKATATSAAGRSAAGRPITDSFSCPYCASHKYARRGWRQKKHERVQLYLCQSCNKTFTAHTTLGKHYPLGTILDAVSIYNLGYSLEATCKIVNKRSAPGIVLPSGSRSQDGTGDSGTAGKSPDNLGSGTFTLQPSSLAAWLAEFDSLCRFSRMRPYAVKLASPRDMIITATLAHRQLYRFRFHRAKCQLIIQEEFKHRRYKPLQEFLELVPSETPHQYFQDGLRASEAPLAFSKKQMIVRAKQNYANRLAAFVLQSVKQRTGRHEAVQKFMLANDSVTIATEVPVYLTGDDLKHLQSQLGFALYSKPPKGTKVAAGVEPELLKTDQLPKLITGHIDLVQIRNGQIHILDYKPNAAKEQPIEQLTLYAMALSRLTGLRLFEFKCAWFDEQDYFEFFPLHVLHKPAKGRRRKNISTKEGVYSVNKEFKKIKEVRPV